MSRIAICILAVFFLSGCKKPDVKDNTVLEQYFETNILNRNFVVSYAKDNANDITSSYEGYIFVLLKTDMYHGPLKVINGNREFSGSWSSNEDYGKLTIKLPGTPPEFAFLTRDWRFTSKALPVLKLAPWGSVADTEVHMTRQ